MDKKIIEKIQNASRACADGAELRRSKEKRGWERHVERALTLERRLLNEAAPILNSLNTRSHAAILPAATSAFTFVRLAARVSGTMQEVQRASAESRKLLDRGMQGTTLGK